MQHSREDLGKETFIAVSRGDAESLKECCNILSADPSSHVSALAWTDDRGVTPLILAARRGLASFVQLLLELGADVNFINFNSNVLAGGVLVSSEAPLGAKNCGAALHEAAYKGYESIVRMLLDHGANPWVPNRLGSTPFEFAQQSDSVGTVALFKQCAQFCSTVRVKCSSVGYSKYKPCEAVVTPCPGEYFPTTEPHFHDYLRGQPIGARVYFFAGKRLRAQACLRYKYAQVSKDASHRAQLVMQGGTRTNLDEPRDDRLALQGMIMLSTVVHPLAWSVVGAWSAVTAHPHYLKLMVLGDNPALNSSHFQAHNKGLPIRGRTSIFLRPLHTDAFSIQSYHEFLDALLGRQHQAVASREDHQIGMPDSPTPVAASAAHSLQPFLDTQTVERRQNRGTNFPTLPEQLKPFEAPSSHQAVPEDAACIICLSEPRQCGYLHGTSMHACVCRGCARALPSGACPLCRQPVERILEV
ncbi:ankyrin repeat-containing domain protein [Dunaliella salina]|uniref:Ankyrin repeat-containing domain protein n=1 Tax=Dunaliella salina TaxID=3046 RepID=A0ABQ7G1Y7_DUNSA|nr:ankyrin repeat-containing domain protein [Dunaliella salina]|eukprot:KAF5828618.1 ankyrin repeat-containing domain protein [Dunaliella salina]